jgi:hypothetical protein
MFAAAMLIYVPVRIAKIGIPADVAADGGPYGR